MTESASAPLRDRPLPPLFHDERTVWNGFRQLDMFDTEVSLSAARAPTRLPYEVLRVGRIAAVLPYDPRRGRLLVIRQFRVGAHLAHGNGANIEVIAGRVDPGEDVEAAARREAFEEGGLVVEHMEPMLDFVPAPSAMDEYARLYLARADLDSVPAVTGEVKEQETILPLLVTPDELYEAARAGRVRNGYTLLAIAWFMLHRAEIDARWSAER